MREIHGQAGVVIEGDPRAIFEMITDIERLPEWNEAIEQVIDGPAHLTTGASWTVEMHPSRPMRWKSVSTLRELDPQNLRFSYRTVNADGNPSYSLWCWKLAPAPTGAEVSVGWDVYLETIDRRLLAGPIRCRQLRKEVTASLGRLADCVAGPRA